MGKKMGTVLLTGGSGRLGQEIQKYMDVEAPSSKELDVLAPKKLENVEMVIHAAALTDVAAAEVQKKQYFATNTLGTHRMLQTYDVPFVFISTEYVHNPVNFYTLTKLEAEHHVNAFAENFLIIRTLFKERPFPYDRAFKDQYTTGDYVDVIGPLVVSRILRWNRQDNEIADVGTGRKTMYELAKQSRDVEPNSVDDITEVKLPKDYQ